MTGLDYDVALVLVANLFLFLALATLFLYVRHRTPGDLSNLPYYAPLMMALFPAGFYFRMAYSESLFLFLAVLALYGLSRGWPVLVCALIVGLATATRVVGLALIPLLVLATWRRYPTRLHCFGVLIVALPTSVWGLAAFCVYQDARFGDSLAFCKSQSNLRFRAAPSWDEHILSLVTLEPLRASYDAGSKAYWAKHDRVLPRMVSLQFANSIYFASVVALIAYGTWRRWVSWEESLFAAGVLLIPYTSRGYEMCMASHARYASVAFPVYIVIGRMISGASVRWRVMVCAPCVVLLTLYSALFAGWYLMI